MPHVLPAQDEAALELNEYEPPLTFDANVDNFFLIFGLPQDGQATSSMAAALRTSSSKGWPHSVQMNSNRGMIFSGGIEFASRQTGRRHSWD
jgi:hypothetical protein